MSEQETKAEEEKLLRELHNLEEMSERPIYDANSMEELRKRLAKYAMDAGSSHSKIPYGNAMLIANDPRVFRLFMESGLKPDSYDVWPCSYNTARHNNCGHGTQRPVFEADPTNARSSAGRTAQYFGEALAELFHGVCIVDRPLAQRGERVSRSCGNSALPTCRGRRCAAP